MTDKLKEMFDLQLEFQHRIYNFSLFNVKKNHVDYIRNQTLACIDELMEALRNTPWKPWKKHQEFNKEKFREELIDVWHFLINITLASGLCSTDLHALFLEKNKVNNKRQDEGY